MHRPILIIGNGPAAWGILSGLASAGSRQRAAVVAPEWPAPSVPGLSQVALGNVPIERAAWKAQRNWPAETMHGWVEHVDVSARTAIWRDGLGQEVVCRFDVLAAATGTKPRSLALPDGFKGRVMHFHGTADLAGWMALQEGERVTVVGGGLVGAEMVEMAVQRGCEVHWVMREDQIWSRILPPVQSSALAAEAMAHGVQLHFGTTDGMSLAVALGADVVGLAIGSVPEVPNGFPRSVEQNGFYIAGDASGGATGWAVAMAHGVAVGCAMAAGKPAPTPNPDGIPFRASFFRRKVVADSDIQAHKTT